MGRTLLAIAIIALTVFALTDCIRTEDEKVRGIKKIFWIILIVLTAPVGPLVWLIAGKDRSVPESFRRSQPNRPMAPDDDVDFLRSLEPKPPTKTDPGNSKPSAEPPGPKKDADESHRTDTDKDRPDSGVDKDDPDQTGK